MSLVLGRGCSSCSGVQLVPVLEWGIRSRFGHSGICDDTCMAKGRATVRGLYHPINSRPCRDCIVRLLWSAEFGSDALLAGNDLTWFPGCLSRLIRWADGRCPWAYGATAASPSMREYSLSVASRFNLLFFLGDVLFYAGSGLAILEIHIGLSLRHDYGKLVFKVAG